MADLGQPVEAAIEFERALHFNPTRRRAFDRLAKLKDDGLLQGTPRNSRHSGAEPDIDTLSRAIATLHSQIRWARNDLGDFLSQRTIDVVRTPSAEVMQGKWFGDRSWKIGTMIRPKDQEVVALMLLKSVLALSINPV